VAIHKQTSIHISASNGVTIDFWSDYILNENLLTTMGTTVIEFRFFNRKKKKKKKENMDNL